MIRHASSAVPDWLAARRRHGAMLLALDFDGTLAPIAPRPSDAVLPAATRDAIDRLARRADTHVAVISGRGLADVAGMVGLDGLFYAGNHGLEISGPGVQRVHAEAAQAEPALRVCLDRLRGELAGISGAMVEDKHLSLSVHYRLVRDEAAATRVRSRVHALCGAEPGLRITEGKKLVEVRPAVEWDKGRALRFLIDTLLPDDGAPVLFAGDDITDEDGFRAIAGRGEGIIVADPVPPTTGAAYFVRSPQELADVLGELVGDAVS